MSTMLPKKSVDASHFHQNPSNATALPLLSGMSRQSPKNNLPSMFIIYNKLKKESNSIPNIQVLTSMVNACRLANQPNKAQIIFHDLELLSLPQNATIDSKLAGSLLCAFTDSKQFHYAIQLLQTISYKLIEEIPIAIYLRFLSQIVKSASNNQLPLPYASQTIQRFKLPLFNCMVV